MSKNRKAYDFATNFSEMEKTTEFDNHGNHTTIVLNVHLSALEACADKTDVLQDYGYPSFEEMLKDDIVGVVQLDAYENNSIALTLILYSVPEKDSYPIPLSTEELTAVRQEIEKILHIDLSELAKAGAENDNTRWNVLVQESIDFQNEHELEMNGLAKKYILISSEMIEPDDYIATEPEYVAVSFSLPDNMTERLLDREGIAEEYNFKSGKEMIDSDFWIDYEAVIDDKGLYELRCNISEKQSNVSDNHCIWLDETEREMLASSLEKAFCADFGKMMELESNGDSNGAYTLIEQSRKKFHKQIQNRNALGKE